MSQEFVDYYAILGVESSCSLKELKRAYRDMALRMHPDKNPDDPKGAAARFALVVEANEVLSNDELRAQYDVKYQARAALIKRDSEMSESRKKMKLDLERREMEFQEKMRDAQRQRYDETIQKKVQDELKKFRMEISEKSAKQIVSIAIRWKHSQNPSIAQIEAAAKKFGKIVNTSVSVERPNQVVLTFQNRVEAKLAVQYFRGSRFMVRILETQDSLDSALPPLPPNFDEYESHILNQLMSKS
jgi:DnaJ family protein C protein 17